MPHVPLNTPTGPIEMYYNIATPTSYSSPTIAAHLPCILFLHSGYASQEIFECQFSDPRLRKQFNLIAVDMRVYGLTKGLVGKQDYSPADSADDIYRFLKALQLPPVHIFGLAIGCCIALDLASNHPELVLTMTLCSPLPATEPEDIAAGRLEVYHLWVEAFNHDGHGPPVDGDHAVLGDLIHGAQQLYFNNEGNRLTDAMSKSALRQAIKNQAGSPLKVTESYQASIGWFLNRKPIPLKSLAKIQSSIQLIHCADDVAYPLRHAQELAAKLRQAGLTKVDLCQVPGPHCGNVVNPQAINPILLNHALSASTLSNKNADIFSSPAPEHYPYECVKMVTPFTKKLAKYGYDPHEHESDSD